MGTAVARSFPKALAAALALTLAVAACDDDDGSTRPGDGTLVRGVVRDAADGSRIKNAKVTFRSDTEEAADDRTNGDGEFSMTIFSRSDHGRVEASKSGFTPTIVSVYLDDGDVSIDLDLEPK